MKMRVLIALLLVSASSAGCTIDELIPDPPGWNAPDWITEYHNFTFEDNNNSTLPVIVFGSNETFLDVYSVEVAINGTGNISYPLIGYLNQSGFLWDYGFAPYMGNATLVLPEMVGYDYNCTVVYREWDGGPYE